VTQPRQRSDRDVQRPVIGNGAEAAPGDD